MIRTMVCLVLGLAFAMPVLAEDKPKDDAKHLRGKIVKVNADTNTIMVRTGEGDQAKDTELRVNATTKFFGADRQPLAQGLKAPAFKEGADIWYRVGTGADATVISELRFFDPALPLDPNKKDG